MKNNNITILIESQRLTSEYSEVKNRIKKIYILDPKIEIVQDIISGDVEAGAILIQSYVKLINLIGNENTFFFDEFLANVCLEVFNMQDKSGDYKKDIETSCQTIIKAIS